MISLAEFEKIISPNIWNHLLKETYVPYIRKLDRRKTLEKVYLQLVNNYYNPSSPRDYVVTNKHNLVSRIVPSFNIEDYIVYYYCTKMIEDDLIVNHTPGTYGGFRLNGTYSKKELEDEKGFLVDNYAPPFSINPFGWAKAWKGFQKKVKLYASKDDYEYFIKFDIANFYDNINLDLLEKRIRLATHNKNAEIVNLLFFFLRNWNRKFLHYSNSYTGVPQDEVGECSRLLANFYLQEYDKFMFELCKEHSSTYVRYADDQIIMAKNQKIAEKILFEASKELHKLFLNINSSKVNGFTKDQFNKYWAFDIFELLNDKEDKDNIERAINLYFESKDSDKDIRRESILKRILNCNLNIVDFALKRKVINEVIENYIPCFDEFYIVKTYKYLSSNAERKQFLIRLKYLCDEVPYNKFHYVLLRASKQGVPIKFKTYLKQKVETLKFR